MTPFDIDSIVTRLSVLTFDILFFFCLGWDCSTSSSLVSSYLFFISRSVCVLVCLSPECTFDQFFLPHYTPWSTLSESVTVWVNGLHLVIFVYQYALDEPPSSLQICLINPGEFPAEQIDAVFIVPSSVTICYIYFPVADVEFSIDSRLWIDTIVVLESTMKQQWISRPVVYGFDFDVLDVSPDVVDVRNALCADIDLQDPCLTCTRMTGVRHRQ